MARAQDAQSLSVIAANSALASRAWLHERLGRTDVKVSCVCPVVRIFARSKAFRPFTLSFACFALVDRYNGPVGEHERVTQKTMLRFKWRLEADDFNEECDVQLLRSY